MTWRQREKSVYKINGDVGFCVWGSFSLAYWLVFFESPFVILWHCWKNRFQSLRCDLSKVLLDWVSGWLDPSSYRPHVCLLSKNVIIHSIAYWPCLSQETVDFIVVKGQKIAHDVCRCINTEEKWCTFEPRYSATVTSPRFVARVIVLDVLPIIFFCASSPEWCVCVEYTSWDSSLCKFLKSCVASFLLVPYIFLSTLYIVRCVVIRKRLLCLDQEVFRKMG